MKLYADTHIPKQVAIQLRQQGLDVMRCEEVGLAEASDIEHWHFAQQRERAILTHDDDFLVLASQAWNTNEQFSGVIYGASHLQGRIGTIVRNCLAYKDADLTNQVIYMQSSIE